MTIDFKSRVILKVVFFKLYPKHKVFFPYGSNSVYKICLSPAGVRKR